MQSNAIFTLSVLASAALSARRLVAFDNAHATGGEKTLGVARYDAGIGEVASIDVLGTARVELGGAVAAGGPVKAGAGGVAVAQAGTGEIAGYALQGGDVGETVEVLLTV